MYRIEFAHSFEKDLRRIPREVQRVIFEKWIPRLRENPLIGERFHGKQMKQFQKIAFRYKRNDYRIVYEVHQKEIVVVLLAVGSRENFYKKIERRLP